MLQRVLTTYRAPFFDALAEACKGGVSVLAGGVARDEGIQTTEQLTRAELRRAQNRHLFVGTRFYMCWQQGAREWLIQWNPDLLVVEANPRLLSTRGLIQRMRSHQKPVVGWGLGVLPRSEDGLVNRLRMSHLQRFLARFDAVIAYSEKGKRDYLEHGIAAERIFVAPNAVPTDVADRWWRKLQQEPQLRSKLRSNLGLEDLPVVLFVGRLVPPKRVADLIVSAQTCARSCQLLIVGDGILKTELEYLAASGNVPIRFLGHVEGEDLAPYMAVADLFALPGTGGLALQEAMAYGKAVLCSEADGTERDLVQSGVNGCFFPRGDVPALSRIMGDLMGSPDRLRSMGAASRKIIEESHNLCTMRDAFLDAFHLAHEVVKQRRGVR